ncbi:maleylacetoacetate isomerase 2-like protein [Dinothrombium tinctorium]|uniref:maleylacetoacetate isomerase n=1 Tax=Dinothrombium tinctorium TaxID=1965070 RepID=A0A443QSC6_9ACAR|nr:maleylacetoacetate isomerase 2-like protein [Dinothrombium tinctorium]
MGSKIYLLFSNHTNSSLLITALALKGVDYEYRAVNLLKGEQYSDEFKKVNPNSFVPTLVVNENNKQESIVESMAILEYLEEKYPQPNLLPKDALNRAKVRSICESIVSGIQPLQNLVILKKVEELGGNKNQFANSVISDRFRCLETLLKQTSGKYCFGDQITLADLCLVPQVYNAYRFSVDMSAFPIISSIVERLKEEEAFKKAHPDAQPDSA